MTEAMPATEEAPAGGRGRPRPQATIERDDKVLEYLKTQRDESGAYVGKTRDEVAGAVALEPKQVYLSFYRLKRDGKIVKASGAHTWSAAEGA